MADAIPRQPLDHPSLWRGQDLCARADWEIDFTESEIEEFLLAAESSADTAVEEIELNDIELPKLASRLALIQHDLEHGSGAVFMRGLPAGDIDQATLARVFWIIAVHLGIPLSQSAEGERLFSVVDKGYATDDPRTRGPNTSRKLSYHTDRCDVIGFCCHRRAKSGGENRIVSSMALYNEILERFPDLLEPLCEPFYYLRQTVD